MTWDDVKNYLEKHGPSKTSAIADALGEPMTRVSAALSYQKVQGGVTRNSETQMWALADSETGGDVAVIQESSVRQVPTKPRGERQEKTLHEATAERLENQVAWAQEALDEWVAAKGAPKTKVLVDNLLAAKAAQLAFQAEE